MRVQDIAIIGAGPSGLAAAKYLLAEKCFKRVVIFEQRSKVGGVWLYTPEVDLDQNFSVPQTDPMGSVEPPFWRYLRDFKSTTISASEKNPGDIKEPIFVSPVYDRLETNIPHSLMRYSDLQFPTEVQLFPEHQKVLDYLETYSQDIKHLIKLETQVTSVSLLPKDDSSAADKWSLGHLDLRTGKTEIETFDAVVIANGHYNLPYIPDIEGIKEWNSSFPGSISHSKYFRRPEEFSGKKVIIVGNSASGLDIGGQISTVCKPPLLQSQKSESYLSVGESPDKLKLPPISAFDPSQRAVSFTNGHVERDVDSIVFCTGYFYSFPFMSKDIHKNLIKDGKRVCKTYQHILFAPHPSLSLLALVQQVIPFQIAEVQSAVVARIYSGRLQLPSQVDMQAWEEKLIAERGDGDEFHTLQFPKDANYINEMHDWAMSAATREGLDNEGRGKIPPRWGEWERWCRKRFPEIRKAFNEKGNERHWIKKLDELGILFKPEVSSDPSDP